ncbi:hypothetical protein MKK68_10060 [Methylobacterium sp. E-016]|uniref:hypothetical protein n=1 Tax=Methylobacterium sp. E-016 TaxID=2836556 RepID=UPI001FB95743|nr:hypothetical protein [Methylobacterium sp. E-016]MCJ2075997.1 hypothetical protein [Methylobacterium sp. E-016]
MVAITWLIASAPPWPGVLERAIEASDHPIARMAQGATTDDINLAVLAPIGSVLIRCRDGGGWRPFGIVDPADIAAGLDVLTDVVNALASGSATTWPSGM